MIIARNMSRPARRAPGRFEVGAGAGQGGGGDLERLRRRFEAGDRAFHQQLIPHRVGHAEPVNTRIRPRSVWRGSLAWAGGQGLGQVPGRFGVHRVIHRVLGPEVGVQRGRAHAHLSGDLPQRDRSQPVAAGQVPGRRRIRSRVDSRRAARVSSRSTSANIVRKSNSVRTFWSRWRTRTRPYPDAVRSGGSRSVLHGETAGSGSRVRPGPTIRRNRAWPRPLPDRPRGRERTCGQGRSAVWPSPHSLVTQRG